MSDSMSVGIGTIESMFEDWTAEALTVEIESLYRQETLLMSRRLAVFGALLDLRTGQAEDQDPDPGWSTVTGFKRTSAEVAAIMNMAPRRSAQLVGYAETLRTRLPRLAAVFATGAVDWPTVQIVCSRTELVASGAIATADAEFAERITAWGSWSRRRVVNAVDAIINAADPDAVKLRRQRALDERYVTIDHDPDGMARVRAKLPLVAGAAIDRRLADMAAALCADDPRTRAQRRADALSALIDGRDLACDCARDDCPRGAKSESAPVKVVLNVIAAADAIDGFSRRLGYLQGFGVIDAALVDELADGAAIRTLAPPEISDAAALRYQPTPALARYVRARDLTCRYPGCDRPAGDCDLDHTVAFNHDNPAAGGRTVAANLAAMCREHHRLKTFHTGEHGWRVRQLSDATMVWTSPTGREYRTVPAGVELFPELAGPACATPKPRNHNRARDKAAQRRRARTQLCQHRPISQARSELRRARYHEVDLRKWRNHMRFCLLLFKGRPSTSPWCTWVNSPDEPEYLPPDWVPPSPPATPEYDEPPF